MTKIIAVLLAFISLLTFFLFKSSDTDTNMIDTTTTTTQPVFLPPGYDMEKIIRESKTLDEFIIYADEFFVFQSSWFARYKEEGKDDVIYSLTCDNDGSKELINRFLEIASNQTSLSATSVS